MNGWLPMSIGELAKRMTRPSNRDKALVVVASIIVFLLIIDMELSNISDLLQKGISSASGIYTFILICGVYLLGQYIVVRAARTMTVGLRTRVNDVRYIDTLALTVLVFITFMFLVIITEIILDRYYEPMLLIMVTISSNILTAVVMMVLFRRLLGYYKSHPEHGVFSYAISGFIISITAIVTICFTVPVMLEKPEFISPDTPIVFPKFTPGSVLDALNYAYYILSVLSFLSVWICTFFLLKQYSKKMGKTKYAISMGLPLAFYLGQIVVLLFQIPIPLVSLDQESFIFYYRVIFTVSSTLGGILFSQPFFLISRMIPHDSNMRRNLIILGIGIVLFFVSGSATLYHAPFPPFGLATVALIGISSYLMFLGLYSSVISLAEDTQLYKLIKKSAQEWKFFLNLSDAEVEKSIISKIADVREVMTKETGISPSVSVSDAKDYLVKVLDEMNKDQSRNS